MIKKIIDTYREKNANNFSEHIQRTVDKYKDIVFPLAAAWKFQQEQKLSSFSDIIDVPEKLGIDCQYDEELFAMLDKTGEVYGLSTFDDNEPRILLNPNQSDYQEDFTFAHELAHHLDFEDEESADHFAGLLYHLIGNTEEFEEYLTHNPEMSISIERAKEFTHELMNGPVIKRVMTIGKILIIPILLYSLIKYHFRKTRTRIIETTKRLWKTK